MHFYKIPEKYKGKVMNIHPGLIPAFCGHNYYGNKVHEAVINYGAKVSGCTVHFADNVYDNGPIIIQRAVPVLDDDTPDTPLLHGYFRKSVRHIQRRYVSLLRGG